MNRPSALRVVAVAGIALLALAAWWWQGRWNVPRGVAVGAPAATHRVPDAAAGTNGGMNGATSGATNGGAVSVEVGRVESLTLEDDAQAVGSLRSRQGVMLRPEVSGRISSIGFSDGQAVRRGQVLIQLDDTLQLAQVRQARAQAGIARTTLQRNQDLLTQNFISRSAVDQSAAALEVAEAQVALAQAQLSRMQVLAPFDGVAGIRLVNVGDYVKDGADLVTVEDLSQVWVDFRLPERFLARVRPGQAVQVSLDAVAGRHFTGRVEALDSLVDANGRSLLVRARLDNPRGVLKSGLFARARIVFARRPNATVVPEEALVPQGGRQYLYRVIEDNRGTKLSQRVEAEVGLRLPGKVEILQGLSAGDLVVTAGQARLARDEAVPLRIVEVGAAPAAADRGRPPSAGASAPPA